MLYTAAILVCMTTEIQTYDTCSVINSEWKYYTENQCWASINSKIESLKNYPEIGKLDKYEVVDAKCISWLPTSTKKT